MDNTPRDVALMGLYSVLCNGLISKDFGGRSQDMKTGDYYVGYGTSSSYYRVNSSTIKKVNVDKNYKVESIESDILKKLQVINSIILKLLPYATSLMKPRLASDMRKYPGQVRYDLNGKGIVKLPQDTDEDANNIIFSPVSVLNYDYERGFKVNQSLYNKIKEVLNN